MSFYEQSANVPLQISWPGNFKKGLRIGEAVSNVDAVATILDLAGVELEKWDLDGQSLIQALHGDTSELNNVAICEHFAHGTDRPMGMVRSGNWKLCYGHGNPVEIELYDIESDPHEFTNLSEAAEHTHIKDQLLEILLEQWGDPDKLAAKIMQDQEDREIVRNVTGTGVIF